MDTNVLDEKFWTMFKGLVAKLVLGMQIEMPPKMIVAEVAMAIDHLLPYLLKMEGINAEEKIPVDTTLTWLIEYNLVLEDDMPEFLRKIFGALFREVLENEPSPELLAKIEAFEKGEKYVPAEEEFPTAFADFLNEMEDAEDE